MDTFEQEITAILNFLRTGEEPNIPWVIPLKDENFVDFFKQWSEEKWQAFEEKVRCFNIPCSIYILLERMVSLIRHRRERGWVIRIGHRWSHGGADSLARCLGIDLSTCWSPELVEGDAKLYDQTVAELWVNLYWSTMSNFVDPLSQDYSCFERIVKFLLKNMIMRLTQLLGSIWGAVKGGVPSGAFNTSHMDSWIMAMYIVLFCVWQVHTAPPEHQEALELDLLTIVLLIVYGDDHLYRKGLGIGATYFSGAAFVDFMWKHFRVLVRDMKDGVCFASTTSAGWIVKCGATFLKHQMVLNPEKSVGQPFFLPFRESREFLIRAVWGRVTRSRDVVDTMLSVLGHAYGTYASNRDAYDRLKVFYSELLVSEGVHSDLPAVLASRITNDDLKKYRQMGLSVEELVSGFPSWETLVQKNVWDEVYQDTTAYAMEGDFEMGDWELD